MKMVTVTIPAATGAGAVYIPVNTDYTVLGFKATPSAVTGCTSSVAAVSGSTTLGTASVLTDTAAGAIISGAMSATVATRKTKVTATVPLKIAVDARTNSAAIFVTVFLDEYALQRD